MSFYVQKRLPLGPIRFGVNGRRPESAIDDDPSLSTGARGEFLRRHLEGFFFADYARAAGPATLPAVHSAASTPFLDSLKPDGTRRGWGFLALMLSGALFVLLGLLVIVRKGPAGWVEVVLGLAMITTPIVLTAQRRRHLREKEARERAAREALEARNRKMLADYTTALERIRTDRSDAALSALERERRELTLSYDIWSAAARDVILRIGFDELARGGPAAAAVINRAAAVAGLTSEDTRILKYSLYSTYVWHLLADDRFGPAQESKLASLREALGVEEGVDGRNGTGNGNGTGVSVDQFRRLRELDAGNPPRAACNLDLAFREYCVLATNGLIVTNRRIVVPEKKPLSIELPKIDEISADADEGAVIIRTAGKPLRIPVEEPILTAALVDLAGKLESGPKSIS